jgi:putative intracellular protease/amidase
MRNVFAGISCALLLVFVAGGGCARPRTTTETPAEGPPPTGKILVVLSGSDFLKMREGTRHATGYFLSELMVPAAQLLRMGFELVFATPNGAKPVVDATSIKPQFFASETEFKYLRDLHDSIAGLKSPRSLAGLQGAALGEFDALFIPGGHAPLQDLYKDPELGRVLAYFHENHLPTA